jgi:hypothetical protein
MNRLPPGPPRRVQLENPDAEALLFLVLDGQPGPGARVTVMEAEVCPADGVCPVPTVRLTVNTEGGRAGAMLAFTGAGAAMLARTLDGAVGRLPPG